jgi:hypothetical protein
MLRDPVGVLGGTLAGLVGEPPFLTQEHLERQLVQHEQGRPGACLTCGCGDCGGLFRCVSLSFAVRYILPFDAPTVPVRSV